jgi:hypothetical protein
LLVVLSGGLYLLFNVLTGSELGSPPVINELSKTGDTENHIRRLVLARQQSAPCTMLSIERFRAG